MALASTTTYSDEPIKTEKREKIDLFSKNYLLENN